MNSVDLFNRFLRIRMIEVNPPKLIFQEAEHQIVSVSAIGWIVMPSPLE
jgi:hypothetical protein